MAWHRLLTDRSFALAAVALVACAATVASGQQRADDAPASSSPPPDGDAAPTSSPAPPAAEPETTLIDAGQSPHQPLRLSYEPGATATIVMVMDMTASQQFGEFDTPPVKMPQTRTTIELTVDRVDEAARHHVSAVYTDWEVIGGADVNEMLVRQRRQVYERLEGVKATLILDARGRISDIQFEQGRLDHPTLAGAAEDLTLSLQQLAVPLPAEPIGVGGRWRTRFATQVSGAAVTIEQEMTVASLDDDVLVVTASSEQHAEPQAVDVPGMSPDGSIHLDLHKATGEASLTLPTQGTFALSGTRKTDLERVVTIKQGGQTQIVRQKVKMTTGYEQPLAEDDADDATAEHEPDAAADDDAGGEQR